MDSQETRRAQLRKWIAANGTPSKEKSYFSQLTGGGASFGEKAARRIEVTYGMGAGYLDDPAAEPLSLVAEPKHTSAKRGKANTGQDDDLIKRLLPSDKGNVLEWDEETDLPPDPERVWIDRYDYHFSAGTGLIQWEVREKHSLPFTKSFLKARGVRPQDCKLLMVSGDSMEPWADDKNMIMVDVTQTRIIDGERYAIYFEDEPLVKQIFKEVGGGIVLHSYNPKYPDKIVPADKLDLVRIVGKVVYRSG